MLSLHDNPKRLRRADNLIPTKRGLATRPGARQIVAGAVSDAVAWGNRLVLEKQGRIALWDGNNEIDIAAAGHRLEATSFQALTANAAREDRLYIADALRPLWYIVRRGGTWVSETVVNKVKDASGAPYDIPVPIAIESWRNRLWIAFGTNRAQHCQNDDTAYWDPVWTIECQGAVADKINALRAHGTALVCGLGRSLWSITGDSQFNFGRDPLVSSAGSAGPKSLTSDDVTFFGASRYGVHTLGQAEPLSEDLRTYFEGGVYPSSCVLDTRRRWLLVCALGRIFVMHLSRPGLWGEIVGPRATGVLVMADYVGWYGPDGVWVLCASDTDDRWLDGTRTPVKSLWQTWDETPNLGGGGRARLTRNTFLFAGSARGRARYRASVNGGKRFETSFSLADESPVAFETMVAGLDDTPWPSTPVRREVCPQLAGHTFTREVEASVHMEILLDDPQYLFAANKGAA